MRIFQQQHCLQILYEIQHNVNLQYQDHMSTSKQSSLPKYHPFTIPPSLQLSYKHRVCSQFGPIVQQQAQQSQQELPCACCNSPPRTTLPLRCSTSQIYEISQPVGYYFTYIKLSIGVLIIIMLIIGVYSLIQIINQCNQQQQQSVCLYVYGIPFPKIHVFFKIPFIILNIIVIIVLYIYAGYLIFRHTYLHQRNICGHQKASDYCVMLSGFKHNAIKIQQLQQLLSQYDIKDIIVTHKIKKYMEWLSQKSKLDALLQIYWHRRSIKKVQNIQTKIKQLQNKMLYTKNKLILGQDVQFRTDKIFIIFQHILHKKQFQQKYRLTLIKNIYHTFCGGSPLTITNKINQQQYALYIQPLGQPNQIIWQNLQVTSRSRYLRVFVSNIISVVFVFGSFVMIVYLSKSQKDQDQIGDILMSLVFAILIQVVNQILTFGIEYFTKWQGRYTMTGQISIKLYKNSIGYFVNSTLLPFLLFLLQLFLPEQDDIIRNILSIFLVSNLVSPYIGLFLSPKYLWKLYARNKIIKQVDTQCIVTQIKSNQTFQKIDFILDQRYANVTQLFMNCIFYAAIFPIGIIITVVGLFITYWSSKWWILNYCSLPKFSFRLGRHINYISCFFPSIYAIGYSANLYMARKQVQFNRMYSIYIAIVTVPISLFFILFGETICKKWMLKHRQSLNQCINKQKHFLTYKKLNPTSFIHDNLAIQSISSPEDMWANLVSYVTAKQSGIIINDIYDSRSSRSSRMSMSSS